MRWEDERWVAFLTTNQVRWAGLSFAGRILYPLLLRIADRAGRIDLAGCDEEDLMRYLRVAPEEEGFAREGIANLSAKGWIALGSEAISIVGFLDGRRLDAGTYVRLYTRDTPAWERLSLIARGLFCAMLRTVDRAGLLPLGSGGLTGLAAHFKGDPKLVDPAIAALLVDGCVEHNQQARCLVACNFIEAQETTQSGAARMRAARERARDGARAAVSDHNESLQSVTPRDEVLQPVALTYPSDLSDPDLTMGVYEDPDRSRARTVQDKTPSEHSDDPTVADVLEILRSASGGTLRSIATVDLAHKIATFSQAGAFMGRVPLEDVLAAVRSAADKESFAIAGGSFPRNKGELTAMVRGFVKAAKRGDAMRLELGSDDAASVFDVFDPLWCKKHRAASRARGQGDDWAAAHIAKESKAHANRVGAKDWKHVLAAAAATYLATDDRWLEGQKYPLSQFSKNLHAYLEHERPKPKREVKPEERRELTAEEQAAADRAREHFMRAVLHKAPAKAPVSSPETDVGAQGTHRAQEGAFPGQQRASTDLRSGTLERGPYAPEPEAGPDPPTGLAAIGNVIDLAARRGGAG